MNVLIVDDEPIVLRLITRFTTELGHTTETFTDPEEALECFAQKLHPIVLTNNNMPKMSGLRMIKKMREMEGGRDPFIMMVSATDVKRYVDDFIASGADDFVRKPIDRELFNQRMALAEGRARARQME